ncbi:hypothetical protein [Streptomyces formicae]|uniref:Secreted protein n=1 Tax=Streptomyces formicae TaxID=1616117 RepID=A0ABY3WM55_9ACTN|nr:hypothetical protein [Streptomyces formicae]UNM12534.1 hypothetical protein J4032_14225 [Streptomyces formicae]
MRPVSTRARAAVSGAFTAILVATALGAAPASAEGPDGVSTTAAAADTPAVQLNGHWAPFDRCPVDSPAMLATDGQALVATCVASTSPGGTIKLGSTTATTGATELQFGVIQDTAAGTFTVVPPAGGSIVSEPSAIPGGLLGLMCPSDIPFVTDICRQLTDISLNRVTATVESVGTPTEYDLTAALSTGRPIVALPVRIHLENPFLGDNCYIGTASSPLVLRPRNVTAPTLAVQRFDADGTPDATGGTMLRFALTGGAQGDSAFSVPGATGCGLAGILNGAVNLKTGLPSGAGNNALTLNSASTYSAGLTAPGLVKPDAGKVLSQYWHSAAGR